MIGSGGLLTPSKIDEVPGLLSESRTDGWLLYDFHEQNPLARRLLGPGRTTRQAFALFPRNGKPTLLHHVIESSAWSRWPWESKVYEGWRELGRELGDLLAGMGVVAMEISERGGLPSIDRVPYGVVRLVQALGPRVVSSAELVTALHGRWSEEALLLHRSAAGVVRRTALDAFDRAAAGVAEGRPIREAELMDWIRGKLRSSGLTDQEDCIVAGGARAADPHYVSRPRVGSCWRVGRLF